MENKREVYNKYIDIIHKELVPALGCTEPIAIAYISSYAKDILGHVPERIELFISGNILKNVKSVVVPNTNHMRGIKVACAAGILFGDASKKLEVIAKASEEKIPLIKEYIDSHDIQINLSNNPCIFDIEIKVYGSKDMVHVRVSEFHTNIVYVAKNDTVIVQRDIITNEIKQQLNMSVEEIFNFVESVDILNVKDCLDRQIQYNMKIADEGISQDYGANIGKVLLNSYGSDVHIKAKAYAAAASDARMNGCELPVIICSGSGNQGISASIPVIIYAKHLDVSEELLYRSLLLSNLITLHIKSGIGRLSAFCGVVCAGAGCGAGIAYMHHQDLRSVSHTIVNALGISSGIICDGAKASCAAKIAMSVEAGILGFHMYENDQQFRDGDGLIKKGVENTIKNICQLASVGMKETDKEIISMML